MHESPYADQFARDAGTAYTVQRAGFLPMRDRLTLFSLAHRIAAARERGGYGSTAEAAAFLARDEHRLSTPGFWEHGWAFAEWPEATRGNR